MRVRAIWLPAAFCALSLAAAACGGSSGPASADHFVVSVAIAEPQHLVPPDTTETAGHQVVNALFSGLVTYDDAFQPVELAAESITSEDHQTWTIRLKDGWTFHNGERVTADSYINAWNAGAYGPNAFRANDFFRKIEGYDDLNPTDGRSQPRAKKLSGLTKIDDLTFTVRLTAPYVNFKSMIGYTAFLPMPLAAFSDVANNAVAPAYEQAPIGQGPFRMKGVWQHDQLIEVERYDAYAGPKKPKVAGVAFKIYQSMPTEYQDLLAGQLDVVPLIPLESMATARADLGDRFQQSPASTIQFLAFPTFDRHYAKVDIRKAISMAIDREEITRTIFLDTQKPLRAFVSPVVPGYRENVCGEACEFNPAKARALFEAAGGAAAVGGRVVLTYNVDGGHKPWIDATCNQIRRNLGVDCLANPEPRFADLLTKVEKREPVGAFRMGWVFDYPAMENYLGPLYSTRGSSNYYGYSNPEFDRLLAEGDRAATPEESIRAYQRAEDILVRDMPVIPLRYTVNTYGYSTRVRNVKMDPFFLVNLLDLEPNPAP